MNGAINSCVKISLFIKHFSQVSRLNSINTIIPLQTISSSYGIMVARWNSLGGSLSRQSAQGRTVFMSVCRRFHTPSDFNPLHSRYRVFAHGLLSLLEQFLLFECLDNRKRLSIDFTLINYRLIPWCKWSQFNTQHWQIVIKMSLEFQTYYAPKKKPKANLNNIISIFKYEYAQH